MDEPTTVTLKARTKFIREHDIPAILDEFPVFRQENEVRFINKSRNWIAYLLFGRASRLHSGELGKIHDDEHKSDNLPAVWTSSVFKLESEVKFITKIINRIAYSHFGLVSYSIQAGESGKIH